MGMGNHQQSNDVGSGAVRGAPGRVRLSKVQRVILQSANRGYFIIRREHTPNGYPPLEHTRDPHNIYTNPMALVCCPLAVDLLVAKGLIEHSAGFAAYTATPRGRKVAQRMKKNHVVEERV